MRQPQPEAFDKLDKRLLATAIATMVIAHLI